MDRLKWSSAIALASLLAACGGDSGGEGPANEPGTATITAASGGSIELPGGPTLQIPPGALSSDTVISIRKASVAPPPGALGTAYELGPAGTTFAQPVTVTLPLAAGTDAVAVWMRSGDATSFESVPTSVADGVATAQIRHFSIIVVGPVDFSGTWTGPGAWTSVSANGTPGGGSLMQARDVTQSVGDVTYVVTNSTGSVGTCRGTLSGSTLDMTCTQTHLAGCTATYTVSGVATGGSPSTWANTYAFEWIGDCGPAAGTRVEVSVTATRQDAPPVNVAGTYQHVSTWTITGPTVEPVSGEQVGTRVRTQAAGSSTVSSTLTIDGGGTSTCRGPIVGNTVHGSCRAPDGAITGGTATVNAGTSPLVLSTASQRPLYGGPYTLSTSTGTETCIEGPCM